MSLLFWTSRFCYVVDIVQHCRKHAIAKKVLIFSAVTWLETCQNQIEFGLEFFSGCWLEMGFLLIRTEEVQCEHLLWACYTILRLRTPWTKSLSDESPSEINLLLFQTSDDFSVCRHIQKYGGGDSHLCLSVCLSEYIQATTNWTARPAPCWPSEALKAATHRACSIPVHTHVYIIYTPITFSMGPYKQRRMVTVGLSC